MIKLEQKIKINADIQKVWFFMSDLSKSLIFDHFFTKINVPSNYSINEPCNFLVIAKYFFKEYKLEAKIKDSIPFEQLEIEFNSNEYYGYSHKKLFILKKQGNQTQLVYKNEGDFHSISKNILYIYILKSSCINELRYFKKAIESSDIHYNTDKYSTAIYK